MGDVYYVISTSSGYIWINDEGTYRWEELGFSIDTSNFITSQDLTQALLSYQELLQSGINIKTINGISILGNGDIIIGSEDPATSYISSFIKSYSCNYINDLRTYSATEKRVGTWIDGKPIYSKTILLGSVTQGNKLHGIANVDQIADYEPFIFNTENGQNWKLPYRTQTYIDYVGRTSVVVYNTTSWNSNYVLYITIYYTKTTD